MQYYFFSYHKVGTVLCGEIARCLAALFGWEWASVVGLARQVDRAKRVVTFQHSLVDFDLARHPHRGVRLIRDPRDVCLSGYQYHRHCSERWCTNQIFDPTPPIMFPQVPYSQQHRPEDWKRHYIAGLGGRSYQQNLRDRDEDSGLSFEMERFASWTVSAMLAWTPDPDTIDVRIEDFMADFDGVLAHILRHFGLNDADIRAGVAAASPQDVRRMSDAAIALNPHISGRTISRWRDVLTEAQKIRLCTEFSDAIERLGYADKAEGYTRPGLNLML
jgi:hypothetical protein